MRCRLAGDGARPLRPPCAAGGAADRLRCLARRLTGQQRTESGPQLRSPGQGHADGARGPRGGPGARDPVLGVQPLRRVRRCGASPRTAGVHINDPDKGRRFVPAEDFDTSFTGVVLVLEPGEDFERGGRKPGVMSALLYPAARHHRHDAGRAARQPAAGGRRGDAPGPEPYLHRHVHDRRADLAAGRAVRRDGHDGRAHGRPDLASAGESAARADHLVHARQRALLPASAPAARHLLLPAQPRRPRPAPPVQRRRRRDPRPGSHRGRRWTASSSSSTPSCCGPTIRS